MTKGQVEYAERQAYNEFDRWNDVVGIITKNSGYYAEIQAVVQDAVHIGIQMAINGEVNRDTEDNIRHSDLKSLNQC